MSPPDKRPPGQTTASQHEQQDLVLEVIGALWSSVERLLAHTERLLAASCGPLQPAQVDDVRTIQQAVGQLQRLMRGIGDMAALQCGRLELQREPVDLLDFCADVVRQWRAQLAWGTAARARSVPADLSGLPQRAAAGAGVSLELVSELPATFPRLALDACRLRQVLDNLLANASKFARRGSITVTLRPGAEQRVELVVADTGEGICSADLPHVFEQFRQAGTARGRRQGVGLGLAICRRLTELHGGQIDVASVVGQGTHFTVRLPLTAADAPQDRHLGSADQRLEPNQALAAAPTSEPDPQRFAALLLAHVSHELRSPLSTVIGFAELMAADLTGPLSVAQRDEVEQIRRLGRDVLCQVNELLDVACLRLGRLELLCAATPPGEIIRHALAQLRDEGVPPERVRAELAPELPAMVRVDGPKLAEAIKCLTRFCLRRSARLPHQPDLVVRVRADSIAASAPRTEWSSTLSFELCAEDVVLSEHELACALRGDRLAAPTGALGVMGDSFVGVGLELPLVHGLVELHGGRLAVRCVAGGGVSFELTVPTEP